MKNPFLKFPFWFNFILLIIFLPISTFTLIFGFAHVVEAIRQSIKGVTPPPDAFEGGIIVMSLCLIGIITLLITIGTFLAILGGKNKS
ncbi:hypothetical protein [Aestuariivivens sediminicola]|uniref:hypothetical protein n=1 Tax=Aestuariivivens sediminicola TaxID=2913560 RepID=UPI001F56F316|nr:hypothetical protein [Aestuariivivens sediminicola]